MIENDQKAELQQQIDELIVNKQHAYIQGNGSRPRCLSNNAEHILSVKEHTGVINYEPSELIIKVRAGTLIKDIQTLLQENHQQLGTDFPDYGNSTIGGAIATGETGSGRPFLGGIRDQVLGLGIINGKAQTLDFGAQVMKNVAGYDVSRLLCGSLGQFALITDVTLKVLPLKSNTTVELHSIDNPLEHINRLAGQALPITAAVIEQGTIRLRLSGSQAVVDHAIKTIGAQPCSLNDQYWASIGNGQHEFFQTKDPLYQVRLDATQVLPDYDSKSLIDWCGHQRYIKSPSPLSIDNASVLPFKNIEPMPIHSQLDTATQKLHSALKTAFDADNLFNRS